MLSDGLRRITSLEIFLISSMKTAFPCRGLLKVWTRWQMEEKGAPLQSYVNGVALLTMSQCCRFPWRKHTSLSTVLNWIEENGFTLNTDNVIISSSPLMKNAYIRGKVILPWSHSKRKQYSTGALKASLCVTRAYTSESMGLFPFKF